MTPKPPSCRVGAARRSLAFLYALLMCGVLGASCSNLLGLDNHASAVSELCELIDRCYGPDMLADCDARLGNHLMTASSESREGWLRDFGEASCLESCANAWLCLDTTPVCGAIGDSCTTPTGCCGFTDSVAACSPAGSCCVNKGHACESSEDCCLGQCRNGLCGGQQCKPTGEPCVFATECCSNACVDDVCDEACLPGGAECTDADDCCSRECVTNGTGEDPGICTDPECTPELFPCEPDGLDCCNGGQCVFIPVYGGSVCTVECWPQGSACNPGAGDACCSGQCDPTTGSCTVPETNSDTGSGSSSSGTGGGTSACLPQGDACTAGNECCAQQCFNGYCCQAQGMGGTGGSGGAGGAGGSGAGGSGGNGAGGTGGTGGSGAGGSGGTGGSGAGGSGGSSGCLSNLCEANQPPSAIDCQCTAPACSDKPGCIAQICAEDPFCCCVSWDQLCVNAATQFCGLNCPLMTGMQQPK